MKTQLTFLITSTCLSGMHLKVHKMLVELMVDNKNMVAHIGLSRAGNSQSYFISLCTMTIRVGLVFLWVQHTDGEKRNNFY